MGREDGSGRRNDRFWLTDEEEEEEEKEEEASSSHWSRRAGGIDVHGERERERERDKNGLFLSWFLSRKTCLYLCSCTYVFHRLGQEKSRFFLNSRTERCCSSLSYFPTSTVNFSTSTFCNKFLSHETSLPVSFRFQSTNHQFHLPLPRGKNKKKRYHLLFFSSPVAAFLNTQEERSLLSLSVPPLLPSAPTPPHPTRPPPLIQVFKADYRGRWEGKGAKWTNCANIRRRKKCLQVCGEAGANERRRNVRV